MRRLAHAHPGAFMKSFAASALIRASPETVWSILTDGSGYSHWNPEILQVEGKIALGQKLTAHLLLHGGVIRRVPVRVTTLEAPHRMIWTAGMPLGLFTGRRTFAIKPCESDTIEFTMHLHFSGPLSWLIAKSLGDRQPDIEALVAGLKKWAERE
jgi:hypothetical protein